MTSYYIQIKIKMKNPSQEDPSSSEDPNQDLKDMDVLSTFKIKIESPNFDHRFIKDQWPYPNHDQDAKLQSGTSSSSKPQSGTSIISNVPNNDLKDIDILCTLKIKIESKKSKMGVSKTNDHIWIRIKMPNPSHESPSSSKAPNKDLKDMDVLCTIKFKI